jgi:cytochrome c oxidase subunit 2
MMEPAFAARPHEWQLGLQDAATPVAERVQDFHTYILYIITAITLFVMALLVYVMLRFNARANPKPSRTSHNAVIEVVWTVVPLIIVILIAVPSFKLMYYMDRVENPDMTLKVTGYQWYWGYDYPDHGDISFRSYMKKAENIDTSAGEKRLLSTTQPVVVPVDTNIQVLVTSADVLHSFAIPSFGIKKDAVPGRLNETWMRIEETGTYYGQCSELCGDGHGYMPVEVRAVSKDKFQKWVKDQGGTVGALDKTDKTAKSESQKSEGGKT